jgi:hypothetical protein
MSEKKSTPARSNGKHPGGRPSKYHPSYCQEIVEFIKAGGETVVKPMVVSLGEKQGSEIIDHPIGKLPAFFEDFADKIGVAHKTLLEWCKAFPEFRKAYQKAKELQLARMIQSGLAGVYQPACLIFALKNMHGWRDGDHSESDRALQPTPKFIFHLHNGTTQEVSPAELLNGR